MAEDWFDTVRYEGWEMFPHGYDVADSKSDVMVFRARIHGKAAVVVVPVTQEFVEEVGEDRAQRTAEEVAIRAFARMYWKR